jgi:hypothetical protein
MAYNAQYTTVTDQAGSVRQNQVDGLSHLIGVVEDPGSPPHLNYQSVYGYDALDNLVSVKAVRKNAQLCIRFAEAAEQRGQSGERRGELYVRCRRESAHQNGCVKCNHLFRVSLRNKLYVGLRRVESRLTEELFGWNTYRHILLRSERAVRPGPAGLNRQ